MRTWPILLAVLGPLAASTASAQFKPTIRASAVPETARFLNIEEIEDDAPIELEWAATVNAFDTYEFEISYDEARSMTTSTVTLVRLDDTLTAGENEGVVISGALERFRIRPSQIVPADAIPGGTKPADDSTRNVIIRVFRASSPLDPAYSETAVWKFEYDTKRPPAPTLDEVVSGENRLEARWTAASPDTDVDTYAVVYCPTIGTATVGPDGTLSELPCAEPAVASGIGKTQTSFSVTGGLMNGVPAAVAVRSTDAYGNVGEIGTIRVATPSEVTDFFELYKEQGGAEDGGFCFIATAAYGSYAHPAVRILRRFRDVVLETSPAGAALVALYYERSPPLADAVRAHPWLAAWTRAALVPIALLAGLWLVSPLLALGLGAMFLVRRGRRRVGAGGLAALVVALTLPVGAARADYSKNRPDSDNPRFGVGFELRGGPYLPELARSGVDAFERSYGTSPNPLYSVGVDLQLLRGYGTLGIGGSFGFMQFVGKAFYGVGGPRSQDTTVFNLMPLQLGAFYRFDWLADRSPIPFVPYLRGGLAYHVWWVTTGTGDIARWEGQDPSSDDDDLAGRGGKLGYFGTAGMAVLLNIIDGDAARSLFDSTGIRGTYVFVEYGVSKVDGFGEAGFDLSDDTWNLGIYFEW